MIGGYVVVIANCPACGTHFKHEQPVMPARGRCGRCDATIDLTRLRPYRIVALAAPRPEDVARAARHLPIGLDDPALATTIARNVRRPESQPAPLVTYRIEAEVPAAPSAAERPPAGPASDAWESDDPLPPIPEMSTRGAFEPSVPPVSETDILVERAEAHRSDLDAWSMPERPAVEGRAATFVLWLAAGAIVGTGASWTLGGTTLTGVGAGAAVGALTGWGWVRWTSPK